MIQKRYLHISFNFLGQPLAKELEPIFNSMAENWIRYTPTSWIVWTQYEPSVWFGSLKPYIKNYDQMLIVEMKSPISAYGWMYPWVWNWLNENRQ